MPAASNVDRAEASAVRCVAWTSRAESVLWFLLLLPVVGSFAGMLPLAMLTGKVELVGIGLFFFLATPVLIAAGLYAFAVLFDSVLGLFRLRVRLVPEAAGQAIDGFLEELAASGLPRISTARVRYVPNDLSLGAHVRGVLVPRIVISGGLLVLLMKRESAARAMFAHELAHIAHWDRLYVGLLAVAIANAGLPLIMLAAPSLFYRHWDPYYFERVFSAGSIFQHLVSVVIQCFIFSYFSKRREYAADYVAVRAVGSDAYLEMMGRATRSHSGGYFHPTVDERISAVQSGGKVEKPAWLVLVLAAANAWPLLLLPGVDVVRGGDELMMRVAGFLTVVTYFALTELLRLRIRWNLQDARSSPPAYD